MPHFRRVIDIEKMLGFKWAKGFSKNLIESTEVPIIKDLNHDIDDLKQDWAGLPPGVLRKNQKFKEQSLDLFHKYAETLWAPLSTDRSAWLVDATINNWNSLYPRDLSMDTDYVV